MNEMKRKYYAKRGNVLVNQLKSRHFDAYYCETKEEALKQALALIPEGDSVGWGGSVTCQEIGLMDAIRGANYQIIDRETAKTPEEQRKIYGEIFCLLWRGVTHRGYR